MESLISLAIVGILCGIAMQVYIGIFKKILEQLGL